jgi:tRNA nucleotidyltransferase (CCA-adding enzyme)
MRSSASDPRVSGLNVYMVGGAVRDGLLGRDAGDRDWVVVGSAPAEMIARGFIAVGADFPVFLHPDTKEEYALARTERKSGRGYKGFTFYTGPDVTLEEDLNRRDLTINAMARSLDGRLVDPLGGARDLTERVLRHVGAAFEEDPVRILRLARFAARFTDFSIAPETVSLCQKMVALGEADALVPERVWQEVSRGLLSEKPSRLFDVLVDCQALDVVMPGFVWSSRLGVSLDGLAEQRQRSLPAMYALAMVNTPSRDVLSQRLRAPTECADWARLLPQVLTHCMRHTKAATAEHVLGLIEFADGIRRPERLESLLKIVAHQTGESTQIWLNALQAARSVNAGEIAKPLQSQGAQAISLAVRAARLDAIGKLIDGRADHPG